MTWPYARDLCATHIGQLLHELTCFEPLDDQLQLQLRKDNHELLVLQKTPSTFGASCLGSDITCSTSNVRKLLSQARKQLEGVGPSNPVPIFIGEPIKIYKSFLSHWNSTSRHVWVYRRTKRSVSCSTRSSWQSSLQSDPVSILPAPTKAFKAANWGAPIVTAVS